MFIPTELPPAWIELLAVFMAVIVLIGIPTGYIICRDYSLIWGIITLLITACCWGVWIYSWIKS